MLRIHRLFGRTIVLVTHDIDEALRPADHLVLMDGGEVVQQESRYRCCWSKERLCRNLLGRSELGVRLLATRRRDYLRRDERLAGDALNVSMTLREALSQFVAHRRDVLPVVDEQGEACGTLHLLICYVMEVGREGAAIRCCGWWRCLSRCCWCCPIARRCLLAISELPRPVYQQESFLALTLAHFGWWRYQALSQRLSVSGRGYRHPARRTRVSSTGGDHCRHGTDISPVAVLAIAVPVMGFGWQPALIAWRCTEYCPCCRGRWLD